MNYHAITSDQLGKVLQSRRNSLSLTQKEAGKIVGLLPKTVSALENKPESSSIASLFKYLSALGLEIRLQSKDTPLEAAEKVEW